MDSDTVHRTSKSTSAHQLGRDGEARVARMFDEAGWTVLGRNFRDGPREIDLVVRRGSLVVFVEVKARSSPHGSPLESVNWKKRRHLARAAAAWIRRHGRPDDVYRFDVVAVLRPAGHPFAIEWLEDAWRIGG